MRVIVIRWRKSAVKTLMPKYMVVHGGGWHIEWWWRSGRTDSHRAPNVPCAFCPMYTVSSITSMYTPQHWKLLSPGWCIDSTVFFFMFRFTDWQAWMLKQQIVNNIRCYKQKVTHDLRKDRDIWFTFLCMSIAVRVQGIVHVCDREKVGEQIEDQ